MLQTSISFRECEQGLGNFKGTENILFQFQKMRSCTDLPYRAKVFYRDLRNE